LVLDGKDMNCPFFTRTAEENGVQTECEAVRREKEGRKRGESRRVERSRT